MNFRVGLLLFGATVAAFVAAAVAWFVSWLNDTIDQAWR